MEETLLERQAVEIELYKRLVAKQDKIINELKIQIGLKDEMIKAKTTYIAELRVLFSEACDISEKLIKERELR